MSGQSTSCYCLKVRKASASVTKFYDHMLEPVGVTVRQYSLLLNISRRHSISIRELADITDLERSTLARNLKPLFHKELILDAKLPGARDCKLELTENGLKALAEAQALWQQAQNAVMEKLGAKGLEMLEYILHELEEL